MDISNITFYNCLEIDQEASGFMSELVWIKFSCKQQ